jgi:voltage-gated potassium channel Kch
MATTPFLMMFNDWLDRRGANRAGDGMEGPEHSGLTSAIVVGYGRFGQTVAQLLMAKGISLTLIDSKPSQIELAGTFGAKVYYGDGTRLDLLRLAGAGEARAILFCIDGDLSARRLEPVLEAFPQAAVFVRAFDRVHLIDLAPLDIECTVREVYESAVMMGREALGAFGVDAEEAARVEQDYRARDLERLDSQTASGDLHSMKDRLYTPEHGMEGAESRPG